VSVTVRDIAAAAGVSPGTASRALRGHPLISEVCIARVQQVAEALGYRPLRDRTGRRRSEPLAGKRIAIAMLGIDRSLASYPAVGEAVHGVEEALSAAGAHPVLVNVPDPAEPPRSLRRTRFDGIIAKAALQGDIMTALGSKLRGVLESNALVWILGRPAGVEGDVVNPDNLAIGRIAADALIAAGHTRLAIVNPKADHTMFAVREHGFREAAAERAATVASFTARRDINAGFPIQPIMDVTQVQPLVDALLCEQQRPTAIFCPADSIAAMTYRALASRGLQPGTDISVVSCNNERSLVAGLWPALATIDVHLRQIGQLAVRQLIRRITGEFDGSAVTIDVKPTLLPEASIAPPRPDHDGDAKPGARRRRAAGRT
jgi:DNA-binding LacI/PurR family transcriptional regulator